MQLACALAPQPYGVRLVKTSLMPALSGKNASG